MSQNNSNDVKSNEVGLIPFEVLEIVNEVSEIPEGVKSKVHLANFYTSAQNNSTKSVAPALFSQKNTFKM
ncbi:hypothetical protein [Bacillus thuringiensis]|uniref:hypothetical protein n=1 Tax=Bacillus thuringiensis TaxID=1428 RepID=UPI00211E8091|nr:hypothetical protein [Bacillus thuringiensis]